MVEYTKIESLPSTFATYSKARLHFTTVYIIYNYIVCFLFLVSILVKFCRWSPSYCEEQQDLETSNKRFEEKNEQTKFTVFRSLFIQLNVNFR